MTQLQWKFNQNMIFFQENVLENTIWKLSIIVKPRCANSKSANEET